MTMKNVKLLIKIIENGMNQSTFAVRVQTSDNIVSEVVNKKRNLSDKQEKMWAKALKCEVSDIFGWVN